MQRTCPFIEQHAQTAFKLLNFSDCTKKYWKGWSCSTNHTTSGTQVRLESQTSLKDSWSLESQGSNAPRTVSGEKPANTTLLAFVSTGGMASPPMCIFKGSKVKTDARNTVPSGWLVRPGVSPSKKFPHHFSSPLSSHHPINWIVSMSTN